MARQTLRFVRGFAAQIANYTGISGEPVFNADTKHLHVMDGATPGGAPLAFAGPNADITSLSGLTTALSVGQGGTGAKTAPDARTALGLGRVDDTSDTDKVASGPIAQAFAATATRYQSVAAAKLASVPALAMVLDVGGYGTAGIGAARYARSATTGPGFGRFQSQDGAWWALAEPVLGLEMLGAGTGSAAADAAALRAANSLSKVVRVDSAVDVTGQNLAVTDQLNVRPQGSGSIKGAYRTVVVPDLAPGAFEFVADDLDPAIDLKNFNAAARPRVGLFGDSLTTDAANNIGHVCMLRPALQNKFMAAAAKNGRQVDFFARGIGGLGWYNIDPAHPLDVPAAGRGPDWLTQSRPWLDYAKDLRLDTIVISLGMNLSPYGDLKPLRAALAYIATWDKVPDVIIVTNAFPRPTTGYGGGFGSSAEPETRIAMAGLVRSAIRSGLLPMRVGLIDIARAQHRAQLGFDPIIGALGRGDNPAAVAPSVFVGTRPVYDGFALKIRFDASQMIGGTGDGFSIPTGSGADDVIQILKAPTGPIDFVANAIAGAGLGGGAEGAPWLYASAPFTRPPGPDGSTWIRVEKHNGRIYVYADSFEYPTDGGAYSLPQLASMPCISHGGSFTPAVQTLNSKTPVAFVIFEYMDPAACKPASNTDTMWHNDADGTQVGPYAGSGFNHYGNWFYAFVIAPMLASTRFFSGSAALSQSVSNAALLSAYLYN